MRAPQLPSTRSGLPAALGVALALLVASCAGTSSPASTAASHAPAARSSSTAARPPASIANPPDGLTLGAARQPLTTDPQSPAAHDTEIDALAAHSGRLFAATDQWEYPGASPAGQVLVKNSRTAPWTVFEQTQSVRVEVLGSFPIPADQGLGPGHSLLITQAVVNGRSEIQWLLDDAASFSPSNSYALASKGIDVRSFGAHESGGVWSVYAGAAPAGILRGTWSKDAHTLAFDPRPELTAAPPGAPGLKTQKVTAFTDCGGAEYVSINTKLYRRNDGTLPAGVARWALVYQAPAVGSFNSGLRGLSCVTHDGSPALLVSTEGNGDVYRFDHLPRGRIDAPPNAAPGGGLTGSVPTLEFAPVPAIRTLLAPQGTTVPAAGKGSIGYVIAAYNNFETITIGGVPRQVFGFEWAYVGGCPPTRKCGPTAFHAVSFDAAACFAIRTDDGASPTFALHCLGGPRFALRAGRHSPIRSGEAFVSVRTVKESPFGDGNLYFGGYDCNFFPADGTAWVATSNLIAP